MTNLVQRTFMVRLTFFSLCLSSCLSTADQRLIDYVDPFIGTGGKGNTYPGATVPHGMVQLSPDNGRNGWDWISGYYYPDSVIAGFSHLHLTGTGAGDLYDISFMPTTLPVKRLKLDSINPSTTVVSGFSHKNEQAKPGYYQVYLDDYDIDVELTATTRTGLQRYTFHTKDTAMIKLDLGYSRNWDKTLQSRIKVVNDSTIMGYRSSTGWARDQNVFFYTVFSKSIAQKQLIKEGAYAGANEAAGIEVSGRFFFEVNPGDQILVKTGISAVSMINAQKNLEAEQSKFDFEKVMRNAQNNWESQLNKVVVEASEDNMIQFYTAMYHSLLAPTIYSDVTGHYKSPNGKIIRNKNGIRYSTFSLWDTFRALHPWMTIVHSDKVPDMIQSLLDFYQESGQLPVWNMQGNETNMMMGYHSVPVIIDAYLKEIGGIDGELVLEAAKASAMQDDFGIKEYKALGYVPYDSIHWNVSKTQEYAFDDWCIAQMAKKMGKAEDYKYFMKRAQNYKNHYDTQSSFLRAKSSEGKFRSSFDPLAYHPEDYCEANAWQYYWFAPHDIEGLIELTGGKSTFENKLDQLFEEKHQEDYNPEWISGNIGQYVHGNEPGHHVPYLYQFVNAPEKTQTRVRQIMDELYTTKPDGLCGNEDCGQMSAWYLFSAIGMYPVNPADGKYVFGSPEVEKATINLPNGKKFKIIANNQSPDNRVVNSVHLNGEQLNSPFITHEQIMDGGVLIFEMAKNN